MFDKGKHPVEVTGFFPANRVRGENGRELPTGKRAAGESRGEGEYDQLQVSHPGPTRSGLVPGAGLEPARPRPGDFKSPASTNSATRAINRTDCKHRVR